MVGTESVAPAPPVLVVGPLCGARRVLYHVMADVDATLSAGLPNPGTALFPQSAACYHLLASPWTVHRTIHDWRQSSRRSTLPDPMVRAFPPLRRPFRQSPGATAGVATPTDWSALSHQPRLRCDHCESLSNEAAVRLPRGNRSVLPDCCIPGCIYHTLFLQESQADHGSTLRGQGSFRARFGSFRQYSVCSARTCGPRLQEGCPPCGH